MKISKFYITILAGALGVIGVTTLATKLTAADSAMPSCCGGMAESMSDHSALMEPVKSVYDHYLTIQADLANDTFKGVAENASAIAKAVQGDSMKMLPAEVTTQAETLVKASDLKAARAAFKPLSDSLIKYLADHNAKDAYVQVYCSMARASWLQKDGNVNNPYFGKAMSKCGEIQK
ncbi:MAG TPA: DUF3347 domain-containing protein [Verrucomicrobiae bacterium]